MARIAEISLTEFFLDIDSKNLAIPIILNKKTPIDLRIKAAHKSVKNKIISIDSLAALYQSVDFNSDELNNPKKTIGILQNNKEIIMAYYYQLINVQIFPSERLQALISFWDYAKNHNLEEIAYAISYNITESIEISNSNIDFAPQIATSYIYNQDFNNAIKWIEFYETTKNKDEKISYVRILLTLYSSQEIQSLLSVITTNISVFADSEVKENEELIFILINLLQNSNNQSLSQNYSNIYDNRPMPSIFILENIKDAILSNDEEKFFIYSIISLNNKNWNEIHPEHLKLILSGFMDYSNQKIMKDIILEVVKDYKIL